MDGNSNKVVKETTVSKQMITSQMWPKADIVSNKDTKTEKSKEPNVSDKKSDVNKNRDSDKRIDYQKIIRETKDKDYRKALKVKKGGFVVIRKEDKNTKPIEEEQWYKSKATDSEVIMRIPLRIMMEKNIISIPTK